MHLFDIIAYVFAVVVIAVFLGNAALAILRDRAGKREEETDGR